MDEKAVSWSRELQGTCISVAWTDLSTGIVHETIALNSLNFSWLLVKYPKRRGQGNLVILRNKKKRNNKAEEN